MNALLREAPLTRSVEDYLKAIYHLSASGGFAATRDIAQMLDVAPPSVSGMVKRLSETGLIEHVPYRGVQLTAHLTPGHTPGSTTGSTGTTSTRKPSDSSTRCRIR